MIKMRNSLKSIPPISRPAKDFFLDSFVTFGHFLVADSKRAPGIPIQELRMLPPIS
jgi:hypothetical protein